MMQPDQEQIQLPLDHDFIVVFQRTYQTSVRARSASEARGIVDAVLQGGAGSPRVISVIRADLKPSDIYKDVASVNEPPKRPPPGKPAPPGGTPGTPVLDLMRVSA